MPGDRWQLPPCGNEEPPKVKLDNSAALMYISQKNKGEPMRKSDLPAGIKRYSLSLTAKDVEEFKAHCKVFGLGQGTLSRSADDMVREMNAWFRRAKDTGKLTIKDLFAVIGENIEANLNEIKQEGKDNEKSSQETKIVESRKRRRN